MSLEINWSQPKAGRGTGAGATNAATVSKTRGGTKSNGETRYAFGLTLSEDICKAARILIGDRVLVGFADDKEKGLIIVVKRTSKGGFAVSASVGGKKGSTEKLTGSVKRARICISWEDDLHGRYLDFTTENGGYTVDDEGMLVMWEGK